MVNIESTARGCAHNCPPTPTLDHIEPTIYIQQRQSAGQTRYRVLLHVIRTLYSAVNTWWIPGLPLLGLGDSSTKGRGLQGEQPPALHNIVTYLCNKFCVYYSDLFPGAFYGIP